MQGIVNAKVWDPGKATDEVDISKYHCQALEFIRKNKGSPLSATTLEIYSSYFRYVFTEVTG
jgi:hypothetical protein